jgi:sulfur carrier protein ThiS
MIEVELSLHRSLQRFGPDGKEVTKLRLQPGTTQRQLLEPLNLPPALGKTVFVDGQLLPMDSILSDGSRVHVFPALAGG